MKTEEAYGWALRVGGPRPYLSWNEFHANKKEVKCSEKYHKPMRAVLMTLREFKRLKRIEREIKIKHEH